MKKALTCAIAVLLVAGCSKNNPPQQAGPSDTTRSGMSPRDTTRDTTAVKARADSVRAQPGQPSPNQF